MELSYEQKGPPIEFILVGKVIHRSDPEKLGIEIAKFRDQSGREVYFSRAETRDELKGVRPEIEAEVQSVRLQDILFFSELQKEEFNKLSSDEQEEWREHYKKILKGWSFAYENPFFHFLKQEDLAGKYASSKTK